MTGSPAAVAIDYVVNARLPTEKAHGLQVVRQCEALAGAGADLRLYCAWRFQSEEMTRAGDLFNYYHSARTFSARPLATADLQIPLDPFVGKRVRRSLFQLQSVSFAAWAALHALVADKRRWIYTRDPFYATMLVLLGAGPRTLYEEHRFPLRGLRAYAATLRQLAGVVCITGGLSDRIRAIGMPAERILVAPDGVRLEDYDDLPDPVSARRALGFTSDRPLAVYTGHLFGWKGVDTLVRAAALVPEVDVLIVGGLRQHQERLVAQLSPGSNVHLRPHVRPAEIPNVLAAGTMLVLPNSGRTALSREYTSPMKLFEYMAAGRAIVASDLPSLREILIPEATALMPQADDPVELAAALRRLAGDSGLAARLGNAARRCATGYSWSARSQKILHFMRVLAGSAAPTAPGTGVQWTG